MRHGGDVGFRTRGWVKTRSFVAVVVLCAAALAPADVQALGALRHPSAEEMVTGCRGILGFCADTNGAGFRRVLVQVSDEALYGISGLHVSGARLGLRRGFALVSAEAAQLSSPIGGETRIALLPAYVRTRWGASVGIAHESAALGGWPGSRLVSLTVRSFVWVSKCVRLAGEVDRLRLSGEALAGVDATLALTVAPAPEVTLRAAVDLDRYSGAEPGFSATLSGIGPLRLSFGYEGVTEALKGALAVRWGRFGLAAGLLYHPVLGERRGVTVTWFG